MSRNEVSSRIYVNYGFNQGEERDSPYAPSTGVQQSAFHVPVHIPQVINTHSASAPVLQGPPASVKGLNRKNCKCIVVSIIIVLILLGVAGALIWYFLTTRCVFGKSCSDSGPCIDPSKWCDGVEDCPRGQDEAQCFRLHGLDFFLQMYSPESNSWKFVCTDGWDDSFGRATCQQIGYSLETYANFGRLLLSSVSSAGFVKLSPGSRPGEFVQDTLISSNSCFTGALVTLRCIDCGSRPAVQSSRIVGGQVAKRGAWPWQVSLHVKDSGGSGHVCGGSIITPYWIVTAAHCVETYNDPGTWIVFAGQLQQVNMFSSSGNRVSRIVSHKYDPNTSENDIALMKLKEPLIMSDVVKPVCLPNAGMNFAAPQQCWISGWGAMVSQGSVSEVLREAQVSLIDRSTCNSRSVYDGRITDTMICAGKLEGGVDSCQGDSGGPLVTEQGSVWWLVGDTSWGIGCALRNQPGVYGNVTFFLNWIYSQMQTY